LWAVVDITYLPADGAFALARYLFEFVPVAFGDEGLEAGVLLS
jgi:hypothetical protein